MNTSGHLSTNGGIRGHSAGDIFPWTVLITGTYDDLKYWVVNPKGVKVGRAYHTTEGVYAAAELYKDGYFKG